MHFDEDFRREPPLLADVIYHDRCIEALHTYDHNLNLSMPVPEMYMVLPVMSHSCLHSHNFLDRDDRRLGLTERRSIEDNTPWLLQPEWQTNPLYERDI